jgi:peptidoglycan-associated lipoprotein
MNQPTVFTLVLTAAIGLVACKKQATEEPVAEAPATQNEPPPEALAEAEKADVHVDDEVMKLCDMPAPNFQFNSAKLAKQAKSSLEILADCFISGKAKDKRMALIGHTDPRGEDDYNLALGQRRADSVAKYLKKKGLPNERMDVTSRGEMDATGSDDPGWTADRRVDIRLASN